MQDQRGGIGSFSESIGFEHGSNSSETGVVDQQIFWENNMQNSPSNRLSDYISPANTGNMFLNSNHDGENVGFLSLGDQASNGHHGSSNSLGTYRGSSASSSSFSDPFGPSSGPFDLDGNNRLTRKRKAVELSIGPSSSGIGSSNPIPPSDEIIPRLGLSPFVENGHRNDQLTINSSQQQDLLPLPANGSTENSSIHQNQPVLRIPALRRNFQSTSRWSRNSSSRSNRSTNLVISGDRNELDSISSHPLFSQPSIVRTAVQTEVNWNSNSRPPPSSAAPNPAPHYHPRRLSAFLRRSLLPATDLDSGGGQNSNPFPRIPPSIRNVLDLMRRGEPLRFEDLMILDQSVFYGTADINDRHRDMRLDIDNMSYEELLALEERIGNVSTGLTEEIILKNLKMKHYLSETGRPDIEPCCICQEEYNDADDLGTLQCGHEFHGKCIKQWLQQKNSCPICKTTGYTDS